MGKFDVLDQNKTYLVILIELKMTKKAKCGIINIKDRK